MPLHVGTHRSFLTPGASAVAATVPSLPTLSQSPVFRVDFSNAASITQSGGLISAATDLITGTYQCTAAGALRPSAIASAYGPFSLSCARFGGTQYLTGASVLSVLNGTSHTIVCFIKQTSGTGAHWFGNSSNALNNGFSVTTQSTPRWDYVVGINTSASGILGPSTIPLQMQMVVGVQDIAGSGVIPGNKNQGIYVDSNTLSASGTAAYSANTTIAPTLGCASYALGTHIITGDIGEIIGYGTPLTTSDINNLHFYGRTKWGTT